MNIKRQLYFKLYGHLSEKEMTIIIGPRQAGKTTLMQQLAEQLVAEGKPILFLNLDREQDAIHLQNQASLIKKLQLSFGQKKGYVFIDEIQRKRNAGLFLKGLYDSELPHKFIVSGSGSLELKAKIHESLAGRKRLFLCTTVSFSEYFNFVTDYQYTDTMAEYYHVEASTGLDILQSYLNFGGYPRVVTANTQDEKRLLIDEIYSSYVQRDIKELINIEKIDAFNTLLKLLASQAGKLLSYTNLATPLNIAVPTLKHYLYYAQETFSIYLLTPFFTNSTKELTKAPTPYFYDLGLRNYAINRFGTLQTPMDYAFVFQNFIANILLAQLQHQNATLHYWRSKDKAEVDLVLHAGEQIIPMEIKYTTLKSTKISRSMRSFIQRYTPKYAYIINLSSKNTFSIDSTEIKIIPFIDLLQKRDTLNSIYF